MNIDKIKKFVSIKKNQVIIATVLVLLIIISLITFGIVRNHNVDLLSSEKTAQKNNENQDDKTDKDDSNVTNDTSTANSDTTSSNANDSSSDTAANQNNAKASGGAKPAPASAKPQPVAPAPAPSSPAPAPQPAPKPQRVWVEQTVGYCDITIGENMTYEASDCFRKVTGAPNDLGAAYTPGSGYDMYYNGVDYGIDVNTNRVYTGHYEWH